MSARSSKRRAELSSEMKAIMDDLVLTTERAVKAGLLSGPDGRVVLERGMALQEVAEILDLPVDKLKSLVQH